MSGIAFGINPEKQKIGDILVSEKVFSYELQRVGTDNKGDEIVIHRGDRVSSPVRLVDRFKHAELTWSGAKVRFGLILSGLKLVDNLDFREHLYRLEPESIGGEMESCGLVDAAIGQKTDWIVVKAICDWADGNKDKNKDEYQKLAATNAAEFIFHTLTKGGMI